MTTTQPAPRASEQPEPDQPHRFIYWHWDVFATDTYTGNSVIVVHNLPAMTDDQMARITRELRHFETLFLDATDPGQVTARVFDLIGELPFAGHPVLAAAATLHHTAREATDRREWQIRLPGKVVEVTTQGRGDGHVHVVMDQGAPSLVAELERDERPEIAAALGLDPDDLHRAHPPAVWSTGLRYLIVPVTGGALERAHIARPDFEDFLGRRRAEFAYVLDPEGLEGRHWNNDGVLEDVATGSAAGCVAAYLHHSGRTSSGERVVLQQGRFVGRPSRMGITAYGDEGSPDRVTVEGDVVLLASGHLHGLPTPESG